MDVQIMCKECGTTDKFQSPGENGEVGIHSISQSFQVGVSWKSQVIEHIQDELVNKLGKATTDKERKEILEEELAANAYAETIDFELSFTCKGCGNRITLNDFQLIDLLGF
ncbi:hypothetical protein [Planococcus donghaensis]|uniref:Uncharacterized protein n=1 Tax=Planococcus donghaensis TaxID=414778 RepID=A0A1C7EH09_9BACL|nr:hypothetical protein [Planococcus donghaensis]ANU23264.1 hypothetical protein BCM40_07720 [Planococcus donghaensis]